jgi:chromosome segregation ATPase
MIALPNFKKRSSNGNGASDHAAATPALSAADLALFDAMVSRAERAAAALQAVEATEGRLAQMQALEERLAGLERTAAGAERLSTELGAAQEQVGRLTSAHQRAEAQIAAATEEADQARATSAEIMAKIEAAFALRDQLDKFLALQPQFGALRNDADGVAGQVRELTENIGRLRTVHDDALRAHKHATARLDGLAQRSLSAAGKMDQIERRAAASEQALEGLLRIASGVPNVQHQLGVLKALADQVAQKTVALEQQRDMVERAASQVGNVVALSGQIESALRRQEETGKAVQAIEAKLGDVQSLQAMVLARAEEIAANQRAMEDAERDATRMLSELRGEMETSSERFELENQSLDSVSERIAELRGGVKECETRVSLLTMATRAIGEIDARAKTIAAQVGTVGEDINRIAGQAERLRAVRDDVGMLDKALTDMSQRMERVEAARPVVEVIARDLGSLSGAHEAIRDGLEQVRAAYTEMTRLREQQTETDGWLADADVRMKALQTHVHELDRMKPSVDALRKSVDHLTGSVDAIESRAGMVDDLHRRLGELDSMVGQLHTRSDGVRERMDAAETRFNELSRQAADAQRVATTVASVTTAVDGAERRMTAVSGVMEGLEARAQVLDGLGERMRLLGQELEQRQNALDKATEHLARASSMRREAADAAQHLDELTRNIGGQLAAADGRTATLKQLLDDLDGRVSSLGDVERRMERFEDLLGKWEQAQGAAQHALDQIKSRQAMIDALQGQITHVVEIAETTAENVRSIGGARREIEETRQLLMITQAQLKDAAESMQGFSERKRQVEELEKRLARADALAVNVRSTVEVIAAQRSVVDQVLERSGALAFQMKQAEALAEALRNERALATELRAAVDEMRDEGEV